MATTTVEILGVADWRAILGEGWLVRQKIKQPTQPPSLPTTTTTLGTLESNVDKKTRGSLQDFSLMEM